MLNAAIGGATALSPLALSVVKMHWSWAVWSLALAARFALGSLLRLPEADDEASPVLWPSGLSPLVIVVLVYAICEGSFGSWASVHVGTLALSAFWASMTLVRVILAPLPQRWISRRSLLFMSAAGLARFPRQETQVAGLIVTALMLGEGLGSCGPGLLQRGLRLEEIYLLFALWGASLAIGA